MMCLTCLILNGCTMEVSWVQFLVGAGSSHTNDVKNGSSPCLHGTQDEVGTTKHNWSAWGQYNVTGWVSMVGLQYVIPVRQHYKAGIESNCYKWTPHLIDPITQD